MSEFVSGLICMGFLVAALFFLKFWARTRDGLFLAFFVAFALFGIEQALLVAAREAREEEGWLYLLRLAGFLLIIAGVALKNRRAARGAPPA